MKRGIYVSLGILCVALGALGIILPGLPTTPFLLLAAALFTKSSPKLYQKLIEHPILGKFILEYKKKNGLTLKQKLSIVSIILGMSTFSALVLIPSQTVKLIVIGFGIVGAIVVGFVVRTAK